MPRPTIHLLHSLFQLILPIHQHRCLFIVIEAKTNGFRRESPQSRRICSRWM